MPDNAAAWDDRRKFAPRKRLNTINATPNGTEINVTAIVSNQADRLSVNVFSGIAFSSA